MEEEHSREVFPRGKRVPWRESRRGVVELHSQFPVVNYRRERPKFSAWKFCSIRRILLIPMLEKESWKHGKLVFKYQPDNWLSFNRIRNGSDSY